MGDRTDGIGWVRVMITAAAWALLVTSVACMPLTVRSYLRHRRPRVTVPELLLEPICPAYPEYMYVDFDDGTTRRCKTTPHPVWGFPTTPGLSSPEWEIVTTPPAPPPPPLGRNPITGEVSPRPDKPKEYDR